MNNMSKIFELPEHISNLIAAGEVVERPMNVVKELVENSIDANATKIKIDLTDCGLIGISILDNGDGISQSDLPVALKRHATSKIKESEDLFKIASLGFRGEALPSIASVSDFRITSNNGETNYFLHLKAGKIVEEGQASLPKGTLVEVTNLFYNTPARYKHLGNSYQELSQITDYIYKIAIANPNISFTLNNNDKTLFQTFGNNDILEVINEAYGAKTAQKMIHFSNQNSLYQINGYTTNNEIFKSNRNSLIVIVNGRVIKNLNILYAITDAYQTILPVGKYPITVLNINCQYDLIDVNVHPSKLEIRFTDEQQLRNLITKTIKQELINTELLKYQKNETLPREDESYKYPYFDNSNAQRTVEVEKNLENKNLQFSEDLDWFDNFEEETIEEQKDIVQEVENHDSFEQISFSENTTRNFFKNLTYIGQYHLTYLLFQDETNLYLIDQHAAMERFMYEHITKIFSEQKNECYDLLIPITLELTTYEINNLSIHQKEINNLGIEYEEFGGNSIIVRTIPTWIPKNLEVEFLSDIFNHLINLQKIGKQKMYDSLAKSLSCKKSIKANMNITLDEVNELMKKLDSCEMPYTCPHGRPTMIKFTKYEVEKLFKRVNS